MNDRSMIAVLLKLFPAEWRSEYGIELSSLLERDPLTLAIVWDVFCSGLYQRVRNCPAWTKAALLLACWFLLGLTVNTRWTMSPENYNLFWSSYLPLELGLGYWVRRKGANSPGRDVACAVLLGSLPMVAIELLRELHVLSPTVLDLQGHVWQAGHGFTEFAFRGSATRYDFYAFLVVVSINVIVGSTAGWLGGQSANALLAFRTAKSSR